MAKNPFRRIPKDEEVVVNENRDGEATHGTSKEGDESPVKNTESIPQNDVDEIETTEAPNDIAKEADEARTQDQIEFSDESNPNQKGRTASTGDKEYDQDGNERTDGYSYGVAPDDLTGIQKDVPEQNEEEKPEEDKSFQPVVTDGQSVTLNQDDQHTEWDQEKVQKLESDLSNDKGVSARVTTSVGGYVRVKFFYNNKPLGTYKSYDFKKTDARKHLKELLKNRVEVV